MDDFNYNCALGVYEFGSISHIEQLTGLSQIVCTPTCVTMTISSLIDLILTIDPERYATTGVIALSLSEHYRTTYRHIPSPVVPPLHPPRQILLF